MSGVARRRCQNRKSGHGACTMTKTLQTTRGLSPKPAPRATSAREREGGGAREGRRGSERGGEEVGLNPQVVDEVLLHGSDAPNHPRAQPQTGAKGDAGERERGGREREEGEAEGQGGKGGGAVSGVARTWG